MIVEAVAPCRIDLAGGTLDIYPLYLFEEGGITVNMAVDVNSEVRVSTRSDSQVHLRSLDTGAEQSAESIERLELGGPLDLIARLVRFYRPSTGVNVETRSSAPKGSGLGASSSLLIATSGALNALNGSPFEKERFIEYGAQIEAQNIRIPTGKQDYYPPLYGGVNALWFEVAENRVEPLLVDESARAALERRLILTFTGISHFSGATNWDMMRNYIDGRGDTRARLAGIKRTALAMRDCLLRGDLDAFGRVLHEEWQNRCGLAEGVATPETDALMTAARDAGAITSKLCGAGGGGCMITWAADGAEERVAAAMEAAGARRLSYRIAREGLRIAVREN
jgi:D-glycero-alpha-D-manno-heptose-7-phosphate kinase